MNDSIEEPRRSKLTFVASCDCTDRVEVDQLRRVRKPVSRRNRVCKAKSRMWHSGRSRHAESQNELKAFQICSPLDMRMPGRNSLSFSNTTMMGKASLHPRHSRRLGRQSGSRGNQGRSEADMPENRARFALVRELLAEHRISFRVWTRSEICAEPRLANVGLVLRYRCVTVPASERERIRQRILPSGNGLACALRNIRNDGGPNVLRLVIEGMLHIDWWEPLGLESRVSIMPVGRQTWPSPRATRKNDVTERTAAGATYQDRDR